jgi:hypothetical protein
VDHGARKLVGEVVGHEHAVVELSWSGGVADAISRAQLVVAEIAHV